MAACVSADLRPEAILRSLAYGAVKMCRSRSRAASYVLPGSPFLQPLWRSFLLRRTGGCSGASASLNHRPLAPQPTIGVHCLSYVKTFYHPEGRHTISLETL